MEDCLFCKGKEDKEKIVLENEYAFVMFDEFPVNKGFFRNYNRGEKCYF